MVKTVFREMLMKGGKSRYLMLTHRQFHTWNISFKNEGTQIVYKSEMPDLFFPSSPLTMPDLKEDLLTTSKVFLCDNQGRLINWKLPFSFQLSLLSPLTSKRVIELPNYFKTCNVLHEGCILS